MTTPTRRAPRRRRPSGLLVAALATLAAALLIPSGVTGAFWTSSTAGAANTPGSGDWCATPDPATNSRAVRLADLPTFSGLDGVTVHMVAIPVANNTAWGAGSAPRTLAVKVSSCATELSSFNLRVTAWSNSAAAAANGAISWSSGGAVAPASRLNLQTGYGQEIQRLARWGQLNDMSGTTASTESARRFSWLISSPRSRTNLAAHPVCSDRRSCAPSFLEIDGNTTTVANNWTASTLPLTATYPAATYAVNNNTATTGDWAAANALAGNGNSAGTATTVTLVPSSGDTALQNIDGNQFQWVVMEWWGATAPTSDVIAEIVLQ